MNKEDLLKVVRCAGAWSTRALEHKKHGREGPCLSALGASNTALGIAIVSLVSSLPDDYEDGKGPLPPLTEPE